MREFARVFPPPFFLDKKGPKNHRLGFPSLKYYGSVGKRKTLPIKIGIKQFLFLIDSTFIFLNARKTNAGKSRNHISKFFIRYSIMMGFFNK